MLVLFWLPVKICWKNSQHIFYLDLLSPSNSALSFHFHIRNISRTVCLYSKHKKTNKTKIKKHPTHPKLCCLTFHSSQFQWTQNPSYPGYTQQWFKGTKSFPHTTVDINCSASGGLVFTQIYCIKITHTHTHIMQHNTPWIHNYYH